MRPKRSARFTTELRHAMIGVSVAMTTVVPLIGLNGVGAVNESSTTGTSDVTLAAHASLVCGPVTFEWATGQPLRYFEVNATGVSCVVAKAVVAKGAKWHGVPPAGRTFLGTAVRGPNCVPTWGGAEYWVLGEHPRMLTSSPMPWWSKQTSS
jgi:hypothetical protein